MYNIENDDVFLRNPTELSEKNLYISKYIDKEIFYLFFIQFWSKDN